MHGVEPDQSTRRHNRIRIGHASLAPQKTPAPAERHRGDVKSTPRIQIEALAVREQIDHMPRNDNSPVGGTAIQGGDRAGLAEDAQLVFQAIDLVERLCRRRHEHPILRRQDNLEPARHRAAMHADPITALLLWLGGIGSRASKRSQELTTKLAVTGKSRMAVHIGFTLTIRPRHHGCQLPAICHDTSASSGIHIPDRSA